MGRADEDGRGTDITRVLPVFRRASANGIRVRYADSGRFPERNWQLDQEQRDQEQREPGQCETAPRELVPGDSADTAHRELVPGDSADTAHRELGQGDRHGRRELAQRSLELHHLGWHPAGRAYPVIDWYARYGRYPDDEPGSGY